MDGTGNDREIGSPPPRNGQLALPAASKEIAPILSEVAPEIPVTSPILSNSDIPMDMVLRRSTRSCQPPPYLKEYTS